MPIDENDPYLNWNENDVPLLNQIKDVEMIKELKIFLDCFNKPQSGGGSGIYGYSHLEYMVDHGLPHVRDVWVIANRFFNSVNIQENGSYKPILDYLDNRGALTLSYAIWLHDIGMSKSLAPLPQGKGENQDLLNFINKKLDDLNQNEIDYEILQKKIREYHSLLSEYFINHFTITLGSYNKYPNHCIFKAFTSFQPYIREIGILTRYHQSKYPILEQVKNTTTHSEKKKLFIAALLELFDECDQLTSRIIDVVDKHTLNKHSLAKIEQDIQDIFKDHPMSDIAKAFELCIWTENKTYLQTSRDITNFEQLLEKLKSFPDMYEKFFVGDLWLKFKEFSLVVDSHYEKQFTDITFEMEENSLIIKLYTIDEPNIDRLKEFKQKIIEKYNTICKLTKMVLTADMPKLKLRFIDRDNDQVIEIPDDSTHIIISSHNDSETIINSHPQEATVEADKTQYLNNDGCICSLYRKEEECCIKKMLEKEELLKCWKWGGITLPLEILHSDIQLNDNCDSVTIQIHNSCYKLPDRIDSSYNKIMDKYYEKIDVNKAHIYNGMIVRYLEHKITQNTAKDEHKGITISAMRDFYFNSIVTNYSLDIPIFEGHTPREVLFTNQTKIEPCNRFGNILGFAMNVITDDNYILYGKRGKSVAVEQNRFDVGVSAGFSYKHDLNNNIIKFKEAVIREFSEELGLDKSDIEYITYKALVFSFETWKPEIIGLIKLKLNKKDTEEKIREKQNEGYERFERHGFYFAENTKESIQELIKTKNWAPHYAYALIVGIK